MSYPVQLYIYDLSQGMARSLGPALGLHDLEGKFDMKLLRIIFERAYVQKKMWNPSMPAVFNCISNFLGVWHTAIVVHNTEIFFGGSGIEHCLPGTTMLGQPLKTQNLGSTNIDMENLTAYLRTLGQSE